MAIWILQPDAGGNCCDCAGRTEPCDSCVPPSFDCRSIGGAASICGIEEFIISSPPQRYLSSSMGGTVYYCNYSGSASDCSNPVIESYVLDYDGGCTVNPLDCSTTSTATQKYYVALNYPGECGTRGTLISTSTSCTGGGLQNMAGNFKAVPDSSTQCTVKSVNPSNCAIQGTAVTTLSNPDSDANAIQRLIMGSTWSSWSTVGTDCSNPDCCLAQWQQRAALTFNYQDAEWRVERSGLSPSTVYNIDVDIARRVYGVGDYVHYATLSTTKATDAAGYLAVTGSVPNDANYQSYASGIILS